MYHKINIILIIMIVFVLGISLSNSKVESINISKKDYKYNNQVVILDYNIISKDNNISTDNPNTSRQLFLIELVISLILGLNVSLYLYLKKKHSKKFLFNE